MLSFFSRTGNSLTVVFRMTGLRELVPGGFGATIWCIGRRRLLKRGYLAFSDRSWFMILEAYMSSDRSV
jgi:hypothetical protein